MATARPKPKPTLALVLDTSVLVALLCGWHEHHRMTVDAAEKLERARHKLVLPAHALIETYAVLTRLPPPHRISGADAASLLSENFRSEAQVVALTAREHWTTLESIAEAGIAGGRTYDALIAAVAKKVAPATLLTWNTRNFADLGGDSVHVLAPSEA